MPLKTLFGLVLPHSLDTKALHILLFEYYETNIFFKILYHLVKLEEHRRYSLEKLAK